MDWERYYSGEEASAIAHFLGPIEEALRKRSHRKLREGLYTGDHKDADLDSTGRWEIVKITRYDEDFIVFQVRGTKSFEYPSWGPDAEQAFEIMCGVPNDPGHVDVDEDGWVVSKTREIMVPIVRDGQELPLEEIVTDAITQAEWAEEEIGSEWAYAQHLFDQLDYGDDA